MANQNGKKYSLEMWEEYRESMREYADNVSQQNRQDIVEAEARGIHAPEPQQLPPSPPEIPPAFIQELMPELQSERDYSKALAKIEEEYRATLESLKELRQPKEATWAKVEDSYKTVEELAYDDVRNKSVHLYSKFNNSGENSPERMSLVLPFAFESCQVIKAHLYRLMRGVGKDFCEITGQEPNDNSDAIRTESFMNYQYSHEIPTGDVYADLVHDATVIGTGVLLQTWDAKRNTRHLTALRRQNVWWDKATSITECKVINVRMEVSVGDLYRMREGNQIWFEDSDMESAAKMTITETSATEFGDVLQPEMSTAKAHDTPRKGMDPKYQKVWLDIMMHTEPTPHWVWVVNESLVVSVGKPLIPDKKEADIEYMAPIVVVSPIRRRGEIDGDSFVARILDVQDMSNAALELMVTNMCGMADGIGMTLDDQLIGKPIKVGEWNRGDPSQSTIIYPKSNTESILGVIDWLSSRVTDKITGITPEFKGQAQFAGMTATGTRDLMAQGAQRISPMEDRVLSAMQDSYEIGITLNRLYLNPHKFFRVVGEEGLPARTMQGGDQRPISSMDIIGCSGKDLVPAGFPGSASDMAQKAMNFAIPIMQAGGNPQPLMKEAVRVEFRGRINPNDIFPKDGVGANPFQENDLLMSGQAVHRDPDDGPYDAMHLEVHAALNNDPQWVEIITQNPQMDMPRQAHMAAHMQNLQQTAMAMSGAKASTGFGSGSGMPGENNTPIQAQPKKDSELNAQMEDVNGRMG